MGGTEGSKRFFEGHVGKCSGIVVSAPLAIQVVKEGEQLKVKADEELKVDFKLGKKEKIGEQETQAIQYDLRIKKLQEPMAVTVWIDVKTKLPVKREIIAKIGDNMVTATERYADWSIDDASISKKLELPKDIRLISSQAAERSAACDGHYPAILTAR